MPEQVIMPRLSDTMTEGTVSRWLKRPGDEVKKGEPLVEIETDKANIELEAYASGRLAAAVLAEGGSAPVGEVIGLIALPGEDVTAVAAQLSSTTPAAESGTAARPAEPATPGRMATPAAAAGEPPSADTDTGLRQANPAAASPVSAETGQAELRASPLARRLAREHGLDLANMHGSGPLGRIQKEDVEAAIEQSAGSAATAAAPDTEAVPLSRMQQTIARRMTEAKQAPHFYVSMDADLERAIDVLADLNQDLAGEERVTVNDLFIRAAALTLVDFPGVNPSYKDGELVRHRGIHVGFAVALAGGLVEPVIRDANQKSLRQTARESKELAQKARDGKAEPHDYAGGTFSISNLGMYGVEQFAAIINPPHSAILAIGAAIQKPVVVNGQLVISTRCTMTLSADHRVFYGATAAEFLRAVKGRLEKPFLLLS